MGGVLSMLYLRQLDRGEWNDQIVVLNSVVGITRNLRTDETVLHTRGGGHFSFSLDDAAFSTALSNWERTFPLWTFPYDVQQYKTADTNVWIIKKEIVALQRIEQGNTVRVTFRSGGGVNINMTRLEYDDLVSNLAMGAIPEWTRFLC